MTISNVEDVRKGFEVLQTSKRTQTAVMILNPGEHSSEEMNIHQKSDQIVLVLEGEILAEVGGEERVIPKGGTCIVTAGTPHRLGNRGKGRAVTFNVYSPPEYSPGEKG